jgi:O-antigen ligase
LSAAISIPELPEAPVHPRPDQPLSNEIPMYGVTALLLFSPLAFGAVEPWAIFALEFVSVALACIWALGQLKTGQAAVRWNPIFGPALVFMGFGGLQMLTGTTAYRYATFSELLLYVAYGLICFLIVQCFTRTNQLKTVATVLVFYGAAVAILAILQSLSSPNKLYWLRTPRSGGWIYGPYVNHNHYAGLMELLFPIPLVFAFTRFAHRRERWAAASVAVLIAASIFLSNSRGGMAAFAVQIAIFFWFLFKERSRGRAGFIMAGLLLLSLLLVMGIGGTQVSERVATLVNHRSEITADIRLKINRDTVHMFLARPIAGWGLGTFGEVYPRFRSFYTNLLVDEAHNDYLQLLAETGLIGFGIMIWFLIATIRPALRKTPKWPSDLNGAVALAATLGVSGILVHSLVDFNLHIPANAALSYALCTIAAIEPRFGLYRRSHRKHEPECAETVPRAHFLSGTPEELPCFGHISSILFKNFFTRT